MASITHAEAVAKALETIQGVHKLPDSAKPEEIMALMSMAQVYATLAVARRP